MVTLSESVAVTLELSRELDLDWRVREIEIGEDQTDLPLPIWADEPCAPVEFVGAEPVCKNYDFQKL